MNFAAIWSGLRRLEYRFRQLVMLGLLFLLYVLLFVPIAGLLRLVGRDALRIRPRFRGTSQWSQWKSSDSLEDYFRQY